jgi:hypothetical protein
MFGRFSGTIASSDFSSVTGGMNPHNSGRGFLPSMSLQIGRYQIREGASLLKRLLKPAKSAFDPSRRLELGAGAVKIEPPEVQSQQTWNSG